LPFSSDWSIRICDKCQSHPQKTDFVLLAAISPSLIS
jgi:hypothetical protein